MIVQAGYIHPVQMLSQQFITNVLQKRIVDPVVKFVGAFIEWK